MVLRFQTQQIKSYLWFIFSMFDLNVVQNDFFYKMHWNKKNWVERPAAAILNKKISYVMGDP